MHKWISPIVLVCMLALGTAAWAGEQIDLDCVKMPNCCQITCVMIDLDCYGCGNVQGPLRAEFNDANGKVLGTATFEGDWCNRETMSQLDVPVNSADVSSIRLIKPNDDDVMVTWASIRVYCGDECSGKWYKVFKSPLWCWDLIPVLAPAVPQATLPTPPPAKPRPAVVPPAEPKPDFSYFPAPEPEPEPEVIVVIGNG